MAPTRIAPTGYWWRGQVNFGDLLTPLLLDHFSDVKVQWAPIKTAHLLCVGSVLDGVPPGWSGLVVGSGKLRESTVIDLSQATVLGVRGPLTAKTLRGVRQRDLVIGDPGLLADELVTVDKEYTLGIVPHWSDTELEHRPEFRKYNPRIIYPNGDPLEVLKEIGRCRKVVASSLHGLIVADAFGIPRRTEMTARFKHEGGDFKFRDHCEAIGLPFVVGKTQEANRYKVQARQHELFEMFESVGRRLMGTER